MPMALVPHPAAAAAVAVFHGLVRPEVAAADGGAGDGDERVGQLDQAGVGDVSMRTSPAPNMTAASMVVHLRCFPVM